MGAIARGPSQSRFGRWNYPAVVLLLGVLSLAMLVWTDYLGRLEDADRSQADALEHLLVHAATSHLWLEEGLTGGATDKLARAMADLDNAIRLSRVLLDGGDSGYGYTLVPLSSGKLRQQTAELTRLLSELRRLAADRVEGRAGVGSALDMRYNALFEELLTRARRLEDLIEANQAANQAQSRRLFYGMLAVWSCILSISVLGLVLRERRRQKADEELRASEGRLAAVIDTAMDAIIALDEDQRVVLFNPAAERVFRCATADATGKPFDSFVPRRPRREDGGPLYGRRADGEEFPLEASIAQADTGAEKHYTIILRDLTPRMQAEELARRYAETTELDRLKTEFFANVSHELRTPLALILGPVRKRLATGALREDERRDLERIQRNALLLQRHVNDLLDLSKLDAGRLSPDYAEVDMARLARGVASNFDSLAEERQVTYTVEAPEALRAEVDPDKMTRILINLLSNAFKFTPAGGTVRCAIARSGTYATLEVEDSGPGVPPHLRETIFERFRQADGQSAEQFGGTGLGLAIVKEFVGLHRGCIAVSDGRSGTGALFAVGVPLLAPPGTEVRRAAVDGNGEAARQAVEALRVHEVPSPAAGPLERTGAPAVLVVEDNTDMNAFIVQTLSPTYRVIPAFDGQAGLERALALRPDLILCDLMMPRMKGDQLLRELRRHGELADVPIVLLTARVDEELKVLLLNEGAQDYLQKPFDPDELMAKVGRLLADRRRAAEELELTRHLSARLLEQKDEILKIVSHELRNPLTTIREGVSQVAEEILGPTSPEQREFLTMALNGIDRLSRIINNILDEAQIDAGCLRLGLERVNIVEIARQEARLFEPGALAKGVRIRTEFSHPEIMVHADPDRIAQVFANLLANALKFTEKGEVALTVEDAGARVACGVRDTGSGIAPGDLAKVFQKFYQVERTRRSGGKGTGLGLSIVKAIVELHGGEISVRSELGVGSTFTLVLPKSSS